MNIEKLVKIAEKHIAGGGTHLPQLIVNVEKDGKTQVLLMVLVDGKTAELRTKLAYMAGTEAGLSGFKVLSVLFQLEAWVSIADKDADISKIQPSKDPKRKEVMLFIESEAGSSEVKQICYEIKRNPVQLVGSELMKGTDSLKVKDVSMVAAFWDGYALAKL